ncbi:MAG: AtpZ/AtpI family protein [Planctomycetota bacterium]
MTEDRDKPGFGKTFFGLGPARAATAADDARRRKWAVAGAGTELAAGIGLFAGLGYLVDRWLGSLPWGTVVGALLGMAAGMYLLIKAVAAANQADADDAARQGGKG